MATIPGPLPGILDGLATAIACIWGATVLASFLHDHDTSLCLPCIEKVPADAPVRAERRKIVLWFHHFMAQGNARFALLTLMLGLPAILIALHVSPDIGRWALSPGIAWALARAFATSQHRRLQPWCSYCRDWDKDGDHEPSPDPVAFDTKTLH